MIKTILFYFGFLAITSCGAGTGTNSNIPLTVVSITPSNNSKILLNQSFNITFSANLNKSAINNVELINVTSGTQQPIVCTLPTSNSLSCTPNVAMVANSTYNLILLPSIQDINNNPLTTQTYIYTT